MREDYRQYKKSKAKSFEGFEIWYHSLQMRSKMYLFLLITALIVWTLLFLIVFRFINYAHYVNLKAYLISFVMHYINPNFKVTLASLKSGKLFQSDCLTAYKVLKVFYPLYLKKLFFRWLVGGCFFSTVSLLLGSIHFRKKSKEQVHEIEVLRGMEVIPPKELAQKIKEEFKEADIQVTKHIKIPKRLETQHCFLIGATGTGKSMIIKSMLQHIRQRRERAIVFDVKGEYVSLFYDPSHGDLIFNPLDSRCLRWSILNDLTDRKIVKDFAASFIPQPQYGEPFFPLAARAVLAGILRCFLQLKERGENVKNEDIVRLIFSPTEKIEQFLLNFHDPAATYIPTKAAGPQSAGVHASLMQYAESLELLAGIDGFFSFKQWVKNEEQRTGFLFLPIFPDVKETLSPLFTAVIDLLFIQILSLPDNLNRRIWIVIDELSQLHKLNTLQNFITLARSKGGCAIVGLQDFGVIDAVYGRSLRETLWNNTANKVVLRVDAPDTAQYLASSLGMAEISETENNISMGVEENRDGLSFARREQIKYLFLPSEIQSLPNLNCIVKIAHLPPTRDEVEIVKAKPHAEPLIPREIPSINSSINRDSEENSGGKGLKPIKAQEVQVQGKKESQEQSQEQGVKTTEVKTTPDKKESTDQNQDFDSDPGKEKYKSREKGYW